MRRSCEFGIDSGFRRRGYRGVGSGAHAAGAKPGKLLFNLLLVLLVGLDRPRHGGALAGPAAVPPPRAAAESVRVHTAGATAAARGVVVVATEPPLRLTFKARHGHGLALVGFVLKLETLHHVDEALGAFWVFAHQLELAVRAAVVFHDEVCERHGFLRVARGARARGGGPRRAGPRLLLVRQLLHVGHVTPVRAPLRRVPREVPRGLEQFGSDLFVDALRREPFFCLVLEKGDHGLPPFVCIA
mmetsp:Transcript_56506/g.106067  ORF Transcript_56506/g.106067 Transcript_56506/m.106067 type:complete len:244 (+) Transcript_56506:164-895(+)